MPTYEYKCAKCDTVFEHFQSIKAPKLKKCIEDGCNGKVTRLMGTGAGIIFKGGGFYETDYRSESYKSGEKKATEAKEAAKKKTEEKSKSSSKEKTKGKSSEKKKK